jgi:23S rRNA (uridine2552-2'-O)-methyltransferase
MPVKEWFKKRLNDPYLRKARAENYRSRAAYKLKEINDKYHLFGKGSRVLDLGAAPGSWSQIVHETVGEQGLVVGIDLLEIVPIDGVHFFHGDIRDPAIQDRVDEIMGSRLFDAVISDMAPDTTGIHHADTEHSADLVHLVLDQCDLWLKPGGAFVAKVFEGAEFKDLHQRIKSRFEFAKSFNPKASLTRSREVYVVATGWKTKPR